MAHFYGEVKGRAGEASRLGTKATGIKTVAASWQGGVDVNLWHRDDLNEDWVEVYMIRWNGEGTNKLLYRGPVDRFEPEQ